MQVEWDLIQGKQNLPEVPVAGNGISDLFNDPSLRPIRKVKVMPAQFHFHTASEHLIEGFYVRPLCPPSCTALHVPLSSHTGSSLTGNQHRSVTELRPSCRA